MTEPDQLAGKTVLLVTPSLAALAFLLPLMLKIHEAGASVHLAASSKGFPKVEIPPHVNFHDIDMQRGANVLKHFKAAQMLNRLVKQIKPDIVDTHYSAAMVTSAFARRSHWPPCIATVQGLRFPQSQGVLAKVIDTGAEMGTARRMDQVSILTQCDLNAVKRYGGKNFRLQQSLGFGCNLERYNSERFSESHNTELRNELNLSETDVVCIFVGRYVKFKGFDVALRAFKAAQRNNSNLKLLVCGKLDPYHDSGVSEQELSDMDSDPSITNIGWTFDIDKYLAISDICLFPSEREGVPVSLMEALSMGVPVLTANSRGCRDVVTDQVNGYVLPVGKHQPYAEKLIALADNPAQLKQLSQSALATRSVFDAKHFALESLGQYRFHIGKS